MSAEDTLKRLEEKIKSLGIDVPNLEESRSKLEKIARSLVSSDILLYNTIVHNGIGQGLEPKSIPEGYRPGSEEFGPVLYWLTRSEPPSYLHDKYKLIYYLLEIAFTLLMRESTISPELYEALEKRVESTGVTSGDGTLWGLNKFQQLDKNWLTAVLHYAYYKVFKDEMTPFAPIDPNTGKPYAPAKIPLQANASGTVKIAILGDWGTGLYDPEERPDGQTGTVKGPAYDILQGINEKEPDYIIHLGDVYYAGTDNDALVDPGEEQQHLVDLWKVASTTRASFTMNSNHEMYSGYNGLLKVGLVPNGPFAAQNQRSYFTLTFGDWIILGLDSAYYCDDDNLYMDGRIMDSEQTKLLQSYQNSDKKIILMTHHNGLSYDGKQTNQLWDDVTENLNGQPDYWYWGHIHNGIVYKQRKITGLSNVRCVGHAAIPFGSAWGLENDNSKPIPGIEYFSHTRIDPSGDSTIRVYNGFAIIELSDDTLTETFYEIRNGGRTKIMWSSVPS